MTPRPALGNDTVDSVVIKVAVAVLLVAAVIALAQKRSLKEIFGFDGRLAWWYRDLALATIAGIALLEAVALLLVRDGAFDLRVAMACIVIAVVCCLLSPNRHLIFGIAVGIVAVQGWFSVVVTRDHRSWWIASAATAIVAVFLRIFGNRPLHRS